MSKHPYIAKFLLLALMGLAACSNTFDFMAQELDGPILFLGNDTINRHDSVKVGFKDKSKPPIPFTFRITPDKVGSLSEITVTIEGGIGIFRADNELITLQVQGNFLTGAFLAQKNTPLVLSFLPDTEKGGRNYKLTFAARSRHGTVSKVNVSTLTITTYENLNPVAKLSIAIASADNKYHYTFDASASFDRDKAHGYGGIPLKVYKYTITGTSAGAPYLHQFNVSKDKMPYYFPDTGTFTVSLEVQDTDGGKSRTIQQTVTIG